MYRIQGYKDRGKFVVNLGCLYAPHLLVSSFVRREGKFIFASCEVIIYQLFKENEEADAAEKNEIEQLEQTRQQMKALQS